MGSDNLFHKRREKSAKELQRRASKRSPYPKILIVCEGEKTEPFYFEAAREHYGLNTVNVEVRGDCGSSPISIVNFSKQRHREAKDSGDPFDKIFCVFDKDSHPCYQDALDNIYAATPKNTFFAINSVPSFEYWLLLHFEYTNRPYSNLPGNSVGNQVEADLKKYMPDYEKGSRYTFQQLMDQLEQAKSYSELILAACERDSTDNPSTQVHKLINILQNLKGDTN